MAVHSLRDAGVAWNEVFIGKGAAIIGAAAAAGFAVAVLARRVAPEGTRDVGPILGLPDLPSPEVVLYSNATDKRARQALRIISEALKPGLAI